MTRIYRLGMKTLKSRCQRCGKSYSGRSMPKNICPDCPKPIEEGARLMPGRHGVLSPPEEQEDEAD